MNNSLLGLVAWFLGVQALGFAAWPLAYAFFRNLPDRGYAFTKALGLLTGGCLLWLAWAYGLLPNNGAGAWLAVLLLAAAAIWAGSRAGGGNLPAAYAWLRHNRAQVFWTEAVFLAAFLGWLLLRLHEPAVDHTEQPMDFMLLNALWTSRSYPPHDAWLSGYCISYYYFGQWLLCFLARLAGQLPDTAYNIGQATWFALLAVAVFGLGRNLLAVALPARPRSATAGGLAAAVVVCLTSNLLGVRDAIQSGSLPWWWWWHSSRAITDLAPTGAAIPLITEFPFFSYFLGDNHAHVLASPFLMLALAAALNLFLARENAATSIRLWRRMAARLPLGGAGLLLCAAIGGALVPLNTWDFPAGWLMLVAAYPAPWNRRGTGERLAFAGALAAATVLLFWPYFLTAQSQFAGLAWSGAWRTSWREGLLVFGGFLPGLLLLLCLPRDLRRNPAAVFVGGVTVLGLLLAWVPEWVYVRDCFSTRMNTVFKCYYQAWPLLGLAATWAAFATAHRPRLRWAGALALAVSLLGLVYPARLLLEYAAKPHPDPLSLSASAPLTRTCRDEALGFAWLRANAAEDAVVAEAPGAGYRPETSRASTFTGRPTVLGWEGHEQQWRGASYGRLAGNRSAALEALYTARTAEDVAGVLAGFRIDFVYVGPEERKRYSISPEYEERLRHAMDPVFARGAVSIYRRRNP